MSAVDTGTRLGAPPVSGCDTIGTNDIEGDLGCPGPLFIWTGAYLPRAPLIPFESQAETGWGV